jgi:hypothetical protein
VEGPAKIETTNATAVEAPRHAEQAALDTPEQDSMPTGSIPAPESQGRALVTHPQVAVAIRSSCCSSLTQTTERWGTMSSHLPP